MNDGGAESLRPHHPDHRCLPSGGYLLHGGSHKHRLVSRINHGHQRQTGAAEVLGEDIDCRVGVTIRALLR